MNYIGNCTEDEAWESIYADATDMAQSTEGSVKLTQKEFEAKIEVPCGAWSAVQEKTAPANFEFGYDEWNNVAWAYDAEHDIHYFWH